MSDQANGLKDDISYMRKMAEQGRHGPVLGGVFLAAAGIIYGAACLIQWAMSRGMLALGDAASSTLWWGTSALFVAVWLTLVLRMRGGAKASPGQASFAFSMAWTGCALGIVAMFFAVYEVGDILHAPSIRFLWAPMAFAFYGTAWFVSAGVSRNRWMFVIAAFAYLFAPLLAFFTGNIDALLVMAAGLVLTLVVPGVKLSMNSAA